ncbi:DUF3566 domain-containing protein [Granulicoccus sp. GXG6511]|uniref:DUF3566 domain-containing protein n=1 Tax=Granulicoccus sp. GXG6511 TaxID=3381351 RepID=UPI003D7CDBFB
MSDPNKPGMTPPGAEPDTTMIRPAGDIRGNDKGQTGNRADRVREWVRRNNPSSRGRLPGAEQPGAEQTGAAPGDTPPTGAPATEHTDPLQQAGAARSAASAPQSAPSASRPSAGPGAPGQQIYRSGDQSDHGGDSDTTVLKRPGGDAQADKATEARQSGGFMNKMKDRARTVSTGVAGAAAGAMGTREATGSTAAAVPAPDTSEDTGSIRRAGVARRTRKARLRLSQVDPWSVMKTAFLFSVAAGIVLWVATGTIWAVISSSGMFEEINKIVGDIIQTPGDDTPFRIQDYINTSKVMGTAALIAVIDVVIFTALATLGAFLYNLASAMIGGLELTLAED